MEHVAQLHEKVNELIAHVGQIQDYFRKKAIPVSKETRDLFAQINERYESFRNTAEAGNMDKLQQIVKHIAIYCTRLSQITAQMQVEDAVKNLAREADVLASELVKRIEVESLRPLDESQPFKLSSPAALPPAAMKRIEQFMLDQEKQDDRVKRSLAENEKRLATMHETLGALEKQAAEVVGKIRSRYDQVLVEFQAKEEQLNSMLGHAAGRVIAGDYEKSANSERITADWLRWVSLFCMALIAVALGYSFWETATTDFQWQKSLFRVVLAFLLSAPAAYLARESSKHRAQQYQYHQISLDLKAISPYLASLPDDVQHKIKSDVAAKIFAGKDLSSLASDSYPVNAQELLMELVKKLEVPKLPNGGK